MSIMKDVLEKIKLRRAAKGLDPETGGLAPDPKPHTRHVKFRREQSMFEVVREAVRSQKLADAANAMEVDTFEEANDFEVEDDPFPQSRHERRFDEQKAHELTRRRRDDERKRRQESEERAAQAARGQAVPEGGRNPVPASQQRQRPSQPREIDPEGE